MFHPMTMMVGFVAAKKKRSNTVIKEQLIIYYMYSALLKEFPGVYHNCKTIMIM